MKILIVRFSSIGDVVLTTPVIRALKDQLKDVEIHYLTKKPFLQLLDNNPALDRVHTFDRSINEVVEELKKERFDVMIDLHHNLRSLQLKLKLKFKDLIILFCLGFFPSFTAVRYFFKAPTLGSIPIALSFKITNKLASVTPA